MKLVYRTVDLVWLNTKVAFAKIPPTRWAVSGVAWLLGADADDIIRQNTALRACPFPTR
jgi:hypothetical protein